MGHARWAAMKMPPVSASAAEDMTFLMVLHMIWMGTLVMVVECLAGS